MNILIEHLADHPEHVLILAHWFQEEWGHSDPGESVESRASELASKLSKTKLPMTYVALDKRTQVPVGTYSLDLEDMRTRPHLSPWLASVYVAKEMRGKGIGSLLVRDALKRALELGLERIYLFTNHYADWYKTFGWSPIEETLYCGEQVTVMEIELPSLSVNGTGNFPK